MTPEAAQKVYYDAYRADPEWHVVDRPVVCQAVQLRAWQKVIDAVRNEIELEIAVKLAVKIEEDARRVDH